MELKPLCKILIDHNTKDGFEAITHARQYMLEMGKKELEDREAVDWPIRGSHVLAPVSASLNNPILFLPITLSVLMINHVPYFIREVPPSFVGFPNVSNVLHLFVLLNVLALDTKTYNILML